MNNYLKEDKILIIGVTPPPLGGVSIHCSRLFNKLKKSGYDVELFDLSNYSSYKYQKEVKLLWKLLFGNYKIVHVQSSDYKINKIVKTLKLVTKFKIYLTIHNPRLFSKPQYQLRFFRKYIKKLDKLILVSKSIYDLYQTQGLIFPNDVIIQNAYLPPDLNEEPGILKTYPSELNSFIKEHKPLIIANASVIMFKDSIDLYGLDMCVELTKMLKTNYPNMGFVFALANNSEYMKYLTSIYNKIEEYGIKNNFYLLCGQKQIWPLFRKVNLLIRPTYSDGYPISTVEAIDLGCPVIASDCAPRHKKITLFENRNIDDLYIKCTNILNKNKNEN